MGMPLMLTRYIIFYSSGEKEWLYRCRLTSIGIPIIIYKELNRSQDRKNTLERKKGRQTWGYVQNTDRGYFKILCLRHVHLLTTVKHQACNISYSIYPRSLGTDFPSVIIYTCINDNSNIHCGWYLKWLGIETQHFNHFAIPYCRYE